MPLFPYRAFRIYKSGSEKHCILSILIPAKITSLSPDIIPNFVLPTQYPSAYGSAFLFLIRLLRDRQSRYHPGHAAFFLPRLPLPPLYSYRHKRFVFLCLLYRSRKDGFNRSSFSNKQKRLSEKSAFRSQKI